MSLGPKPDYVSTAEEKVWSVIMDVVNGQDIEVALSWLVQYCSPEMDKLRANGSGVQAFFSSGMRAEDGNLGKVAASEVSAEEGHLLQASAPVNDDGSATVLTTTGDEVDKAPGSASQEVPALTEDPDQNMDWQAGGGGPVSPFEQHIDLPPPPPAQHPTDSPPPPPAQHPTNSPPPPPAQQPTNSPPPPPVGGSPLIQMSSSDHEAGNQHSLDTAADSAPQVRKSSRLATKAPVIFTSGATLTVPGPSKKRKLETAPPPPVTQPPAAADPEALFWGTTFAWHSAAVSSPCCRVFSI